MNKLRSLALSFFKIGLIGFGGGSALISVIYKEIIQRKKLLDNDLYQNHVIVANITPGALPVKLAAAAGNHISGLAGFIISVIAITFPGTFFTVALCSVLSRLDVQFLNQINYITVGVSVFIIHLLVQYIQKVADDSKEVNNLNRFYIIMVITFILTGGSEIRSILGIHGTPIFNLSTISLLILAFFLIFFTCGKISRWKIAAGSFISILYIMAEGNARIISSPFIMAFLYIVMAIMSMWGIIESIRYNSGICDNEKVESNVYSVYRQLTILSIFLIIMILPAFMISSEAVEYLFNGLVSAVTSFGGGEAYLTVADGIFVESGIINGDIFYRQIVPVANSLPGPILIKILSGIGYYYGMSFNNSILEGYIMANAGFAVGIFGTCSVFIIILYIYNKFSGLNVFLALKKSVMPIICGLLISTITSMISEMLKIIQPKGWSGFSTIILIGIFYTLISALCKKSKLYDIIIIILSGFLSCLVLNLL